MLRSLRTRLLWSYIIVLVLTVGMIGGALIVFLRSRPLPTDTIVTELAGELLDVQARDIRRELNRSALLSTSQPLDDTAQSYLDEIAREHEVRTLIVRQSGIVVYDSAGPV